MRYQKLGNTGLFVSELCLGTMTFGGEEGMWGKIGQLRQAEAEQLVGNHVPLADAARLVHPHPTFSETLGEALLKADGRPLHTR